MVGSLRLVNQHPRVFLFNTPTMQRGTAPWGPFDEDEAGGRGTDSPCPGLQAVTQRAIGVLPTSCVQV